MPDWMDAVVAERMSVDQEFAERVRASEFSGQEWNLVMTAVEFEVARPEDPERAHLVADTEKLPAIMPELESMRGQMAAMSGGPASDPETESGDGIVDAVKGALGLGGDDGPDEERLRAAEEMTQEYARKFQETLEENGRWESVREAAADEGS
jgi:hypothetical protein